MFGDDILVLVVPVYCKTQEHTPQNQENKTQKINLAENLMHDGWVFKRSRSVGVWSLEDEVRSILASASWQSSFGNSRSTLGCPGWLKSRFAFVR